MTEEAKNRTIEKNNSKMDGILRKYYKLGVNGDISCDYDSYCEQLKTTYLKNDIDECYRLSCINLLVKGYNV